MRALILGPGASKGAFQVGVLRALYDDNNNLDYDFYSGNSVGALNCAILASGNLKDTLPKLENIWLTEVKGNSSIWTHHMWRYIFVGICLIIFFTSLAFISFIISLPKFVTIAFIFFAILSFYLPYYSLNNAHSIYNTEPLRKLVYNFVDESKIILHGKKFRFGATSFTSGKYQVITEGSDNFKEWIIASCAFPIFFPMSFIDSEYWTDGGVVEIAPIIDLLNMGVTEIDIILASSIDVGSFIGEPSIVKQLQRDIEIISSEFLKYYLKIIKKHKDIKVRVFFPASMLTSNSLNFDINKIKNMYEEGKIVGNNTIKCEDLLQRLKF